ncbi:GH92 family glycosyl hydrolase [Catenulispora pinisilvae]|uniref:GH92 family glycosyl hydrolase n=1 Tax=Catenulispora pinisilvae TaxID=2705253 RepID=UPI001E65CE08|nr:GH92 family glycosyl hydrolase [Catenulispora pinisilvae]
MDLRVPLIPKAVVRSLLVGALAMAGVSIPHAVASATAPTAVTDPASLVNPFIGTANGANDFPGADSPFGMVQWSPDTSPTRPPGGGYAYSDSTLMGYSLTHVPGPGDPVAGDFPILPSLGAVNTSANATFSHTNETADAGYYSLTTDDGIKTELTTTTRSGMARFTFPATAQTANLVFKMGHSEAADSGVTFTYVSANEASGQETTGNFGGHSPKYTVYFDMVFDQPITAHGTDYVSFGTSSTATTAVQAKVGLSYVSAADAKGNWQAENPNPAFDFATVHTHAHNAWNTLLDRLAVSGGTSTQQTVFYTALYHSLLFPQVFSDSNGEYLSADGKTVETVDAGHSAFYTTFSGWDIYRTQAQLTALADPTVAGDIAQSMVDDYTQSGQFPKWSLNNGESYDMAGDPADDILADYYAFGARNFDADTALQDMVTEATDTTGNNIRPGLAYLEQLGYLPDDGTYSSATPPHYYASASTTLEYASNDAAISFLAKALNDPTDQAAFINRAQDWRDLFDSGTGFIQPRNLDGSWMSGFSPTGGSGYCCDRPSVYFAEGDSWQYTPMVPFNIRGLAAAEGGEAKLNTFLDTDLSSFTGGGGHADLTNEPSLDIPWEYDYTGRPVKTQAAIRKIQDQVWTDAPGGLAGNDDLGTMSAWYVWSALGMYPETPGTADLALGSPLFPKVAITLPSGKKLTVKGDNAADDAPYVRSATWAAGTTGTARAWNNAYAPTNALTSGGTLDFALGSSAPTKAWASSAAAAPPSYQGSAG